LYETEAIPGLVIYHLQI